MSTYPKAIQHPVGNVPHTTWASGKPTAVLNHFTVSCGSLWPGAGRFNIDGIGPQFGIRRDGTVCQYVDPDTIATWHAFDESKHAVGIEWEASPPSCPITIDQLKAGAELNAWLCTTFGFPAVRCPGIAFGPGIKVHTDGLEDGGKAWDANGHWDAIWKAAGDPINAWASAPQRAALDTSPWTSAQFVTAVAAFTHPQEGFLMALTDDQQTEVWYRSLEDGCERAGRKIRLGVQTSATVQLTDKKLVVNAQSTEGEFGKANLGLWNAFDLGRTGA